MNDEMPPPTPLRVPSGPVQQVPVVMLGNCQMHVEKMPNGDKAIMIGPLALGIPLSQENIKWMEEQLKGTGIVIPRPFV